MLKQKVFLLILLVLLLGSCSQKKTTKIDPALRLDHSYSDFSELLADSAPRTWDKYLQKVVSWQGEISDVLEDKMDKIILAGTNQEKRAEDLVCIELHDSTVSLYVEKNTGLTLSRGDKITYDGEIISLEHQQNTRSILLLALNLRRTVKSKNPSFAEVEKQARKDLSSLQQRRVLTSLQQTQLLQDLVGHRVNWTGKIDRISQTELIINFDPGLRLILIPKSLAGLQAGQTLSFAAEVLAFDETRIPAQLKLKIED